MTTPDDSREWGSHGLRRLATAMAGQEHVGILGSLLLRLARFLGGDPALYFTVTSTGAGNTVGLPDNTPAISAVLHVQGSAINYRMDGAPVTTSDALVSVGSIITLTGTPTFKGFVFASNTATPASLVGTFFD